MNPEEGDLVVGTERNQILDDHFIAEETESNVESHSIDYQTPLPDEGLREYIDANLGDPFEDTIFKGYTHMNPKQKGEYGERYISKILTKWGKEVSKPENTGHDRIVDGIKTEMKFSVASKGIQDCFTLNHVSKGKDWERLIFLGINLNAENRMYWMSKSMFIENVDSDTRLFNHQQGGNTIQNDDYMITGRKLMMLVEQGVFRTMDEW